MTKPGWACTKCGRDFTRKSSAERHVNTKHSGYGSYVRYSDYLAGRTSGTYPSGEPPNLGTPKRTPTFWERMQDFMFEEFYKETGRIRAQQMFASPSFKLPSFAHIPRYVGTPHLGENIFGIKSYVCSNCLAIKPSTLCFVEGDKGGSEIYYLYCSTNASRRIEEFGSNIEEFKAIARERCTEGLITYVKTWMGKEPELVAVEVADPNRYGGRITFLNIQAGKTLSVTLDYSDELCIRIDPSKTGKWAIDVIQNGRIILNSSNLSEFACMTETASYGFFRFGGDSGRTFLMALTKSGSNTALQLKQDGIQIPGDDVNAGSKRAYSPSRKKKGQKL